MTVTGIGNYTGTATASFEIVKAAPPAIQWPTASGITYGQSLADSTLTSADENGTFAWEDATIVPAAGTHVFAVVYTPNDTGHYDYSGIALTHEMTIIVAPKDLSGMTVDAIADQRYTGSPIEPAVTVRDGETVLTAGVDYTVAYANNTTAGTATATITGIGNYTGTLTATFTILAEEEETQAPTAAEQAEALANGESVEGLVTDRLGAAADYVPTTVETLDAATGEVASRTLVITASPVLDADGQPVYLNGEAVYEQRNLHLSRGLLDALADLGYTHIRFDVKDAALEWAIADMTGEGNVVRLAPMNSDELSEAEQAAIGGAEMLSDAYRARITAQENGETMDVTGEIASLTVQFDAASIRELTGGEAALCLLVPGDGEPAQATTAAQLVEAADGTASYQSALTESGLTALVLQ